MIACIKKNTKRSYPTAYKGIPPVTPCYFSWLLYLSSGLPSRSFHSIQPLDEPPVQNRDAAEGAENRMSSRTIRSPLSTYVCSAINLSRCAAKLLVSELSSRGLILLPFRTTREWSSTLKTPFASEPRAIRHSTNESFGEHAIPSEAAFVPLPPFRFFFIP